MPKKTLKRQRKQRGSGFTIPVAQDIHTGIHKFVTRPKIDKERLSIYQKTTNLKELLAEINIRNGQYIKGLLKSKTPTITAIGKRFVTNPYNDEWFAKNFIEPRTGDSQLDDYIANNILSCDDFTTYLKELYIIITGEKFTIERKPCPRRGYEYFTCNEVLPELSEVSDKHRKILNDIFEKDVMDQFIENYYAVKTSFEGIYRKDILNKQRDNAVKNGMEEQENIREHAVSNIKTKLPDELQGLIGTYVETPQEKEVRLMQEDQYRKEDIDSKKKRETHVDSKNNQPGGTRRRQKRTHNNRIMRNKSNNK